MKTSFSSVDRAKTLKENHIPPLTAQFFSTLIKLETDFINKQYTAETLDQLTQYYAEAVEYYDSHKDPISTYFIFKIQDMLTTKKSMKLLMQENAKAAAAAHGRDSVGTASTTTPPESAGISPGSEDKVKSGIEHEIPDVIAETMGDNSSDDDEEEEEDKVKEMVKRGKYKKAVASLKAGTSGKSIWALKNIKQKLFTLQLKVQKEKSHEKQNLTEVLASFTQCCQNNDKVVQKDIDVQRAKIRNRVARKNKEGFISQSHSSSGFLQQFRGMGDMTIESVLRGLEEEDSQPNPLSNSVNEEGSEQKSQSEGLTIEQL